MSSLHPNIATLSAIYEDLRRIDRYADDEIVLHLAQRDVGSGPGRIHGRAEVVEKMHALLRESGGTLAMCVESIVANDHFGAVIGSIRTRRGDTEMGVPFCGVWRFRDGRIVEHWENSYDIAALDAFLRGEAIERNAWVRP